MIDFYSLTGGQEKLHWKRVTPLELDVQLRVS